MQIREMIKLIINTSKYSDETSEKIQELKQFFQFHGFVFSELSGSVLILNEIYQKERFERFNKFLSQVNTDLKVFHSIWPEFDAKDYKSNPLWELYFPDIFIEGIDFEIACSSCKKSLLQIDYNVRVPRVKSKKPVLSVNGQFTIVREFLKNMMLKELSGVDFLPFDEQEEYFYLKSKNSLGKLINSSDDFLEYEGICHECNQPIFRMFFMAHEYSKEEWIGEDVVRGMLWSGLFFSEKAYKLLRSNERDIDRHGVAILK